MQPSYSRSQKYDALNLIQLTVLWMHYGIVLYNSQIVPCEFYNEKMYRIVELSTFMEIPNSHIVI